MTARLSRGCIRVRVRELAMTMAMLGNADSREELPAIQQEVRNHRLGKYTRYPMEKQWPAYITYFYGPERRTAQVRRHLWSRCAGA